MNTNKAIIWALIALAAIALVAAVGLLWQQRGLVGISLLLVVSVIFVGAAVYVALAQSNQPQAPR